MHKLCISYCIISSLYFFFISTKHPIPTAMPIQLRKQLFGKQVTHIHQHISSECIPPIRRYRLLQNFTASLTSGNILIELL